MGGMFGLLTTVVGEVVSTKLTREKHQLKVRFDEYKSPFDGLTGNEHKDYVASAKGIVLRNTGDYMERDVSLRLRVILDRPERSGLMSINHSQPLAVLSGGMLVSDPSEDSPEASLETRYESHLEFLAPKQELRIDFKFGAEILEVNFTAANESVVAMVDWEHQDKAARYSEAKQQIYRELGIEWVLLGRD